MVNAALEQEPSSAIVRPARRWVTFTPPAGEQASPAAGMRRAAALITGPFDYVALYQQLQSDGAVPNASVELIESNRAVFQSMVLDLGVIKQKIVASGFNPTV